MVAGASPVTSTWTEWAWSGDAVATPEATVVAKSSLVATSQTTGTSSLGMPAVPPLASGSGARRVQRTTASGSASPDATPRVNGSPGSAGAGGSVVVGAGVVVGATVAGTVVAGAAVVPAPPLVVEVAPPDGRRHRSGRRPGR